MNSHIFLSGDEGNCNTISMQKVGTREAQLGKKMCGNFIMITHEAIIIGGCRHTSSPRSSFCVFISVGNTAAVVHWNWEVCRPQGRTMGALTMRCSAARMFACRCVPFKMSTPFLNLLGRLLRQLIMAKVSRFIERCYLRTAATNIILAVQHRCRFSERHVKSP